MDSATLTDNNGRKSDFRNVILIMSSNAGSREMALGKIGFADAIGSISDPGKDGKKALERVFTPEFRNRLDATVIFDSLPVEVIRKVARKFLDELDGQLAEKKVQLEVSPAAIDWFVEHGYDKAMGARPMGRLVQSTLKGPLADQILFGKLLNGGTARVELKDGKIVIECEEAPPQPDVDGDIAKAADAKPADAAKPKAKADTSVN
jgi:ATP-dependent Clp protease ATP-binding subunit ClpA